jgi:hypothetical protein
MTDPRNVAPPANLKMNWFQEPLRDHTDLDGKVSFALSMQPRPWRTVRTESVVRE